MSELPGLRASYYTIRLAVPVDRTIEINPTTLVDVDREGRIIGIETILAPDSWYPNWQAILSDDRFGMRR